VTRSCFRPERLTKNRGELLERPFAHHCETGRLRRVHLRGHSNIRKRLLVHSAALNLALLMRTFDCGTPRQSDGAKKGLAGALASVVIAPSGVRDAVCACVVLLAGLPPLERRFRRWYQPAGDGSVIRGFFTGLLGGAKGSEYEKARVDW
jgi:hypothetical protein